MTAPNVTHRTATNADELEDAIQLHPTTLAELRRAARCQHPTTYLDDHGRIVCHYCGTGTRA